MKGVCCWLVRARCFEAAAGNVMRNYHAADRLIISALELPPFALKMNPSILISKYGGTLLFLSQPLRTRSIEPRAPICSVILTRFFYFPIPEPAQPWKRHFWNLIPPLFRHQGCASSSLNPWISPRHLILLQSAFRTSFQIHNWQRVGGPASHGWEIWALIRSNPFVEKRGRPGPVLKYKNCPSLRSHSAINIRTSLSPSWPP